MRIPYPFLIGILILFALISGYLLSTRSIIKEHGPQRVLYKGVTECPESYETMDEKLDEFTYFMLTYKYAHPTSTPDELFSGRNRFLIDNGCIETALRLMNESLEWEASTSSSRE